MDSKKIEGLASELERCLNYGVNPHYSVVEDVVKVLKALLEPVSPGPAVPVLEPVDELVTALEVK